MGRPHSMHPRYEVNTDPYFFLFFSFRFFVVNPSRCSGDITVSRNHCVYIAINITGNEERGMDRFTIIILLVSHISFFFRKSGMSEIKIFDIRY